MFAVIAWTGCRRGEAAGLQWRDLDLERGSVLISRSVSAIPGGSQVKGTKTGDQRRIAIGPRTVGLLREHRARCDARARACDGPLAPAAFVFSPDPEVPSTPLGRWPEDRFTVSLGAARVVLPASLLAHGEGQYPLFGLRSAHSEAHHE